MPQTNRRAVIAASVALLIIIIKNFVPSIAEPLDLLANPLVDIIYGLLLLYAGYQTLPAPPTGTHD